MLNRHLFALFALSVIGLQSTSCDRPQGSQNQPAHTSQDSTSTSPGEIITEAHEAFLKNITPIDPQNAQATSTRLSTCNCDINRLPVPAIQFGYPIGLKVTPVTPARKIPANYQGAIVRVSSVKSNLKNAFNAVSPLIGGALSNQKDFFYLKDIPFNTGAIYQVQIEYKIGSETCTYTTYSSDGITWTDLNLRPSTTDYNECDFSCTESLYPTTGSGTGSIHNIVWSPTPGQRIKISVGSVIHVYLFNGSELISLGKCGGADIDSVLGSEWKYPVHKIKHAQNTNSATNGLFVFQFTVSCNDAPCPTTACVSPGG